MNLDLHEIIKTLAILVAGFWAYYNWIADRIFVPRCNVEVPTRLIYLNGTRFLIVSIQIDNIGKSLAIVRDKGSGILVHSVQKNEDKNVKAPLLQNLIGGFPIPGLNENQVLKIEPGTRVILECTIEINAEVPDDCLFLVGLRVSTLGGRFGRNKFKKWRAQNVVVPV